MKKLILTLAAFAFATCSHAITYVINTDFVLTLNTHNLPLPPDFGENERFDITIEANEFDVVSSATGDFGNFGAEHVVENTSEYLQLRRTDGNLLWHIELIDWTTPYEVVGLLAVADISVNPQHVWQWDIDPGMAAPVPDPVSTASLGLLALAGMTVIRKRIR